MLRRMRMAPAVRVALMAAGILATTAAFGLHPEPTGADGVAAHRGLASAHVDDAPHACPACLTHGATLTPPRPATLAAGLPDLPALPSSAAAWHGRKAGRDLSGRSPPARS